MPQYEAWLPTWASVRYVLETDEPITDEAELRERMLDAGEPQAGLCHYCSNNIEMDMGNIDIENAKDFPVTEID